ncbi:zinc ABC transporter substrate-binding protein [Aestuariirhabdus sp. Z084]|uniref:metal ABC transporter solute-binding protein, Zn/Mn family n=1 Tax=Aestuariirhabdus haliotis TaxID=2918751 RepID=UPI0020C05E53|nr:zinc ABC transporter substrate-binding protein [Aestuariirhabdus haliotis]MCL6417565.1 zinc ABC transporter substrate-binding protein [Aestuariirhabdus haliotis]
MKCLDVMRWLRLTPLLLLLVAGAARAELTIGITLHPYYSYVKNIVQDKAVVIPLIEAGFNPHAYQLSPADLSRLNSMDVLVVNGIGHDEFAMEAVKKLKLPNLTLLYANQAVPLISKANGKKHNPHTFVAIDAAIRQVYTIARELGKLDPENAQFFLRNAFAYAKKLRVIKQAAMADISRINLSQIRIASTHNAYGYLLQEFGMTVSAVVEPAHGVSPNASQLQETINKIRAANVHILFTELNMPNRYLDVIEKETRSRLFHFSHMTYGDYREDLVEVDMQHNLETLVIALHFAAEQVSP